jgi:dTDP-4-amino-4,6-dideoxygalactose transaminase
MIWLSSPHFSDSDKKTIGNALITNAENIHENISKFEDKLKQLTTRKFAIALGSGTSAIHLALMGLGVGKGDEVLCSDFTFAGSAFPIEYCGAKPVFIDSEPDTWNMSPEFLQMAIEDRLKNGNKPKAIILVHGYGMPAKLDEIMAIATHYQIPIVEDAAESIGANFNEQPTGSFGEVSILSFNLNKIVTTMGGGALLTNNKALAAFALKASTQAREKTLHYEHQMIGYNYRMNHLGASLGLSQLYLLQERVQARRQINALYKELLPTDKFGFLIEPNNKYSSNHWLTCVTLNEQKDLSKIHDKLLQKGIETRPLWKPMHLQPVFNTAPYYGNKFSLQQFNNGLCLPSSSFLTEAEIVKVCNALKGATL